ncbi:hypothetical protein QF034_006672 [Streptomyces africanus]|uniref:Uncharacterized protein n=1 Tax=Streptomyces africanus TaxID=231024 RepID=A0ABU0QYL9_9ACTN|nr:hypothetical protein [Streptomyces africanus]
MGGCRGNVYHFFIALAVGAAVLLAGRYLSRKH